MALMRCIDCGNEVSTAAKACPRCGRPTPIPTIPDPQAHRETERRSLAGALFPDERCVCRNCGSVGVPSTESNGSVLLGLFLCFFFLVPGVIYFAWMALVRHNVCTRCGDRQLVPINAPEAKRLLAEKST